MMGGKNGRPVTLAKTLDVSNYVRLVGWLVGWLGGWFDISQYSLFVL